jgi:hypothetical protein
MSPLARLIAVLALVAGAALFLFALRGGEVDPAPGRAASPGTAPAPPSGPPAKPGLLDSHENCKGCHEEIWNEWASSYHAQAWVDPLFRELSNDYRDQSCHSCHAPRPIHETGFATAEARSSGRESGVNCLTCHRKGDHAVGPIADPQGTAETPADCGPAYDPEHARESSQEKVIAFCGVCHNLHKTHEEFLGSRYAREGMTCLTCHMPEVVRPIVKGGKPRQSRRHTWPGAHSEEMLRTAMALDARREGGRVLVRAINRGAGHRVPTDARHRALHVRVAFFDAFDAPVAAVADDGTRGREVTIDLIRLFYRDEMREPTQVEPDGTLGKENWRESGIAIPKEALGGRAQVSLYYLLRWDWPMEKGVLVQQVKVPLDAG